MLTPALRMLKARWPSRSISVLTHAANVCVLETNPHVDRVLACQTLHRAVKYGNTLSYVLDRLRLRHEVSRAREKVGANKTLFVLPHRFRLGGFQLPMPGVVRRTIGRPFDRPEATKLAHMLGVGEGAHYPEDFWKELYLDRLHHEEAESILSDLGMGRFVVVHPDASTRERSFSESQLRFLVSELRRRGLETLVLRPPPPDADVTHAFGSDAMVSAALIARAVAFVGVDSGPAHVAEALSKPMLVVAQVFDWRVLYAPGSNRVFLDAFEREDVSRGLDDILPERPDR